MKRTLVVPAAGMGTRLRSHLPKLLTPVAGQPMIAHILSRFRPYCDEVVLVINPAARDAAAGYLSSSSNPVTLVEQVTPSGMLDAILLAEEAVRATPADRVWICWCDQVLLSAETLERMADRERDSTAPAAVFPTACLREPYIHFDRDGAGTLIGVRQRREGDQMPEVGETDSGVFGLSAEAYTVWLREYAARAVPGKATAERNFLPFLPWLAERSLVATVAVKDPIETLGINSPEDLAVAESHLRHVTGRASP